jgi:hypothetical protein
MKYQWNSDSSRNKAGTILKYQKLLFIIKKSKTMPKQAAVKTHTQLQLPSKSNTQNIHHYTAQQSAYITIHYDVKGICNTWIKSITAAAQ